MKTLIKLEEIALVILSLYLFLALDYVWWWFPLLFFVPDISLLGYLVNQTLGATMYNITHHKAFAVLLYIFGSFTHLAVLQLAGVVTFGHASFDRALGFELQQSIPKGN
jgi:hypothetical protein